MNRDQGPPPHSPFPSHPPSTAAHPTTPTILLHSEPHLQAASHAHHPEGDPHDAEYCLLAPVVILLDRIVAFLERRQRCEGLAQGMCA